MDTVLAQPPTQSQPANSVEQRVFSEGFIPFTGHTYEVASRRRPANIFHRV